MACYQSFRSFNVEIIILGLRRIKGVLGLYLYYMQLFWDWDVLRENFGRFASNDLIMKLEFLENINDYRDHIIRLYDFDKSQAIKFRLLIQNEIINKNGHLDLSTFDFISPINCNLILRISENNNGILSDDLKIFYCDMTLDGYNQMVDLLEPFCNNKSSGYQWLYDLVTPIEFLFSPSGDW